jgi:hypothetical protein
MTSTLKIVALAGAAFASIGATSEMTAGEFLTRMNKAESLGPAALLSSDVRELRSESDRVSTLYRADIAKQANAKGPRHSCPPPKGQGNLKGEELKAYLTKLSPAAKQRPFRVAMYDFMKAKYPCK